MPTIDIKTVAVFLPFVAAACIGMTYTITSKVTQTITLPTYIFIYSAICAVVMVVLHVTSPVKMEFLPAFRWPMIGLIVLAVLTSLAAWMSALVTIREISPTYAAIGEISYPVFTALFTYLIFRAHELDWRMVTGGLLIAAGSALVITDKIGK